MIISVLKINVYYKRCFHIIVSNFTSFKEQKMKMKPACPSLSVAVPASLLKLKLCGVLPGPHCHRSLRPFGFIIFSVKATIFTKTEIKSVDYSECREQ
ncbi:hypothetical protein JSY36_18560 [Bacillus sp. H-16]|uniref:hypothetical protein n=1 Tax=Alteribacter salitolerans TaxID=2912333 RepID=UPI001962A104|nr:hypothetical protein [Alteribacter salitolerans]MBM7097742.1 hypothetical protein [Alteribacter salitolerans]